MNLNKQKPGTKVQVSRTAELFEAFLLIEKHCQSVEDESKKKEIKKHAEWIESEMKERIEEALDMWESMSTYTLKSMFNYTCDKELNHYKKEIEEAFKKRNPGKEKDILRMINY